MGVDDTLPVAHAASIAVIDNDRWLMDSIWSHQAVGLIGWCLNTCTHAALRAELRVNNARLGEALERRGSDNHIERLQDGWVATDASHRPVCM